MKSQWSDADARRAVARYAQQGVNEDIALRVYTTRLLGGDAELVLHGGGNTSVKTTVEDFDGRSAEVLCVKGSGWDMAEIEPPGLPAVRLEPLKDLERLNALTDEDMVRASRRNLLDPAAPTPSVETLLHAFLPHKFVDHTHANAVLGISDQPDGEAICADLYGGRATVLPWVMPGFDLAKACAAAWRAGQDVEGLVLSKHGIFTFADSAREAYERMIALVDLTEQHLARGKKRPFVQTKLPGAVAPAAEVAPLVRGALALPSEDGEAPRRMILDHRAGETILHYVGGEELESYACRGTVTPDHVIRTKPVPLVLPPPETGGIKGYGRTVREAVARYAADYRAYFTRNDARLGGGRIALDPHPRVVLVPGVGLFGVGRSAKAAAIAADIAEATAAVVTAAEGIGRYAPLGPDELFEMEYWSLEQAKLSKAAEKPLQGQMAAITGGAGAIGRAIATAFRAEGAEVALVDLPGEALDAAAADTGALAVAGDVTDAAATKAAFARIAERFGGLDILVSNAGAAWQGRIGEVGEETLRASFELNFWGHQRAAQAAVAIMRKQATGGALLFNISKQAINPGPDFGPYGIPKAAALALMRQYALEYGDDGIRANAVNADRIRSGLLTGEMIASRSKARGVSEEDYMSGNLLHREVRADDVARAFVDLALSPATTGAVMTVDGGNVAAMLR